MLSEKLQAPPEKKAIEEKDKAYQAAVLIAPGKITTRNTELREPEKNEVRIRLEGSGICASNIPVWEGREWFRYPLPDGQPGHEGWGVIDRVGSKVDSLKVGDRVAGLTFNAFATHDFAQPDALVRLPEFLKGKAFPGEPLGCAMNIFSRSDISKGQTIAIIGCGFLGLLLVQLAKAAGAEVIAISKRPFSLDAAKQEGADHQILLEDHQEIIEQVREITRNTLCDRVIECTGKEWPLNLSIELTRVKGKLIIAAFHQDGMRQVNVQLLNWRGIDMISAHEREQQEYIFGMENAITAIGEEKMRPFHLMTHQFGLEELEKAFTYLQDRPEGFIKALVTN